MFYYTISIISTLIGLLIGMLLENRRLKIKSKKVLEEHLAELDKLVSKINNHRNSVIEIDTKHHIDLIEHSLNEALSEERYEDAAQLRDILDQLKKQK